MPQRFLKNGRPPFKVFVALKKPKLRKLSISKKKFIQFIHLNFITGILYAFYHFLRTPKSVAMPTRRLWAGETWLIFTLYSIFIYLFIIEADSENGEVVFYELLRIHRAIIIKKPKHDIIKVFEHLAVHPDEYQFSTHKGVFPLKGSLTREGSTFYTQELFLGLPLKLFFKTIQITDTSFTFKLIKPFNKLEIMGEYALETLPKNAYRLSLSIYSENRRFLHVVGLSLIFVSPVRLLIAKQLVGELKLIKQLILP